MAQGFELLVSPITSYLGLRCLEHGQTAWKSPMPLKPDGGFDTSVLKCHEKHIHLIDNPFSVLDC